MKFPGNLRVSGDDLRGVRDSVLRAVSLVVTDRRWAGPLSAMALGFGLFLGIAIGPGTEGTFAGGAGSIVAVATPGQNGEDEPEATETAEPEAAGEPEPEAFTAEPEPFESPLTEPAFESAPLAEPPAEEEAQPAEPPAGEELEEEGEAQLLKGTVVHANAGATSYAMAIAGGELVSVHAAKLPLPGEKLSVEASPLGNNTFAEEGRERSGSSKQASIRGVVTYVDPDPVDPVYTLSGRGSSILVHLPLSPEPQLPELGAYATVGVGIEKPAEGEPASPAAEPTEPETAEACVPDPALKPPTEPKRIVVQRSLKTEPEPATYFDLAGVVTAVCPATKQLLISADDLRASEADLLISVPADIKTAKLKLGESIVATATVGEDGTLTLAGLASDESQKGAESTSLAQGDLKR